MSKVYIERVNSNINIDLTNINKQRAEKLQNQYGKSQLVSYCSWQLLKKVILENYNVDIDTLTLSYTDKGKPYFIDSDIQFNITHSNDIIGVIISKSEVGIDIQEIVEYTSKKLAKRLNCDSFDKYIVLAKFSALESYYKKIGTGLLPSQLNENISISKQVKFIDSSIEYYLSICCDDEIEEINYI